MSSSKVSINNLTSALQDVIKEYTDEVQTVVNDATEKYTSQALKEVKKKSPKDTGKYSKGWRKQVDKSRTSVSGVIYNATDYQLVHLLEFGHAIVSGGRTKGKVDAIPHVAEVNTKVSEEFVQEVISKI